MNRQSKTNTKNKNLFMEAVVQSVETHSLTIKPLTKFNKENTGKI